MNKEVKIKNLLRPALPANDDRQQFVFNGPVTINICQPEDPPARIIDRLIGGPGGPENRPRGPAAVQNEKD